MHLPERVSATARSAATPTGVWSVLGDPVRWPEFGLGLGRVAGSHGERTNDTQRLVGVVRWIGIPLPIDVVECSPGQHLQMRLWVAPGLTVTITFDTTASVRGGTDIAVTTMPQGPFARLALLPSLVSVTVTARMLARVAARAGAREVGAA